jgi:hypothetical protein
MQKFVLPIITLIATLAIATEAKALPSEEFLKGATYQGVHKLIDDSNLSLEDKLTALSLVEHAPNTAFNNVDLYCFYKRKGLSSGEALKKLVMLDQEFFKESSPLKQTQKAVANITFYSALFAVLNQCD